MEDRSATPTRNPIRKYGPHFAFDLSHWPSLAKYLLAVTLTAALLGLRWLLDPFLGNRIPAAFVVPAVVFLVVFVGMGPAILATLLGVLGAIYFFGLPRHLLSAHDPGAAILLVFYLLICAAIIATGEAVRRKSSELIESEARFRAFVSASSDVVYSMSPDWKEMRYLEGREFIADTNQPERNWMEKYIHPEDRPRVLSAIEHAIAMKNTFELEHRVTRADDSPGWMHSRAVPLFGTQGEIVQWFGTASDVTSRRQAEVALRQGRETFSELIERAPYGIYVVDSQLRVATMNANSQSGAFSNARPVIGRDLGEVMRILWPESVADEIIAQFKNTLETGEPFYSRDFVRPRQDVQLVEAYEWELHRITLPDGQHGVICYYFDSTKLREAEQALRERTEELAAMFERMPALVFISHDPECRRMTANAMGSQVYGVAPGQNVSASAPDSEKIAIQHFDPSGRELGRDELPMQRAATTGRPVENAELQVSLPDGRRVWIWGNATPLFAGDGKVRGAISTFFDVSWQKQMEEALRTNERLALSGRLSATIAHEIHNPLDTVGNALFLLKQKIAGQTGAEELVDIAQNEVTRVAEISRNLLNLNRDSRAASTVSPSKLLEDSVALIERTIVQGSRRIQLTHGFDGAIEAYPSELRQVFTNVLRNAVEATSDGGAIRITSEPTHQGSDGGVLIKIVDDGVGIPDNFRSKLFSAFVTSKGEDGTGLGLWVSRSIVQRHGGVIAIANNKDGSPGVAVSIFLPSKIGSPARASEAALRQAGG
jgi:signal transduction histidine kinase